MASVEVTKEEVDKRYDGDLLSEFDEDYIATQIEDAVDFADSRWSAVIESRLASGALTPNLYLRTISDAVLRVIRNPGGIASENEGGYGISTRAAVASGNLWFTADDIANLCGVKGTAMPGTVSIGLDRRWR
jgi:hypothetical protein